MIPIPWKLLPYIAGVAVIVGAYHMTPIIGPGARIAAIREARDDARELSAKNYRAAKSWEASFRASESARTKDQAAAIQAATAADKACDARLAETRRSTKVIERIINAPAKVDPSGCPMRSLVDPDELRDALGPAR